MMRVAVVCKLMPYYRLGVFNELSKYENSEYVFLGDTKEQDGIYTIPWEYANKSIKDGGIRWEYSKSIFYRPNRQLWQKGIIKRIFSNEYDLFILEGAVAHFSIWIFAMACKLSGKKVLFWTHGFKGTDKGILKLIRTFFFKYMADGLLLYGDFSRNYMMKEGFNPDRLFTIGNSLNYKEQKEIREQLQAKNTQINVQKKAIFSDPMNGTMLFIGRLEKNKKIDKIIEVLYELKNEGKDLNLIIIGEGAERKNLESLILKYNLSGTVYMAGRVYDEQVIAKYFLMADVMVSPGNVGLNCIHALSFGLPVITHDNFSYQNPEVEAIVEDENGLFYKYNDINDLKIKIKEWFSKDRSKAYHYCIESVEERFNPVEHAALIDEGVLHISKLAKKYE